MRAIHRTSAAAVEAIRTHGFDLSQYGAGAGAGPGEPAGVFVSTGDGADFAAENDTRNLRLSAVLHLRLDLSNVLAWDTEQRCAFFKSARLDFLQSKFSLTVADASAVIRYAIKIMKEREDLETIANWLDTRAGERDLGLFLNARLRTLGFDAVRYKEPFRGVEQLIVLDPSKIVIV